MKRYADTMTLAELELTLAAWGAEMRVELKPDGRRFVRLEDAVDGWACGFHGATIAEALTFAMHEFATGRMRNARR